MIAIKASRWQEQDTGFARKVAAMIVEVDGGYGWLKASRTSSLPFVRVTKPLFKREEYDERGDCHRRSAAELASSERLAVASHLAL